MTGMEYPCHFIWQRGIMDKRFDIEVKGIELQRIRKRESECNDPPAWRRIILVEL